MDYRNADGSHRGDVRQRRPGLRPLPGRRRAGRRRPRAALPSAPGPASCARWSTATTIAVEMGRPRLYARASRHRRRPAVPGTAVDVGNPHLVCSCRRAGPGRARPDPRARRRPAVFPAGVNVEFTVAGRPVGRRRPVRARCGSTSAARARRCPAAPARARSARSPCATPAWTTGVGRGGRARRPAHGHPTTATSSLLAAGPRRCWSPPAQVTRPDRPGVRMRSPQPADATCPAPSRRQAVQRSAVSVDSGRSAGPESCGSRDGAAGAPARRPRTAAATAGATRGSKTLGTITVGLSFPRRPRRRSPGPRRAPSPR